jgi:tetratricopeptide (TPR) repeat protein
MTEHSSDFYFESDPALVDRFEDMLKNRAAYFFDVEDIEAIADHYFERGNHTKARKAVEHGLALHPHSTALLLKKAQTLLMTKQPKKALKILNFLEATEPTNTEMLLFKAVVHRNLSDHEGTKECLLKALKSTPENQEEIFLDLAFEQELVDDYQGAIQSLKQSLEINPAHEASLFELGYCYDMAEELENGVEFFNTYLDAHPYSFVGWYNLALCYEKLTFFEMAIKAVDYCLAIKEDFTNAHILRGNLYTSCDQDVQAIEAYTESLLFDPQNPMVYAAIGECYERLNDMETAEVNYKHALSIDSDYTDALMGMGAVKEYDFDFLNAIAYYRKGVAQDELNLDNWHILAEALVKSQQRDEAETTYTRMVQLFPDDDECWTQLADVQAQKYDHMTAAQTLQAALDENPQSGELTWHLAKHLLKAGKTSRAETIMQTALTAPGANANYFLEIYPEAVQFPNIAALIEIFSQPQSKNEL